MLACPRASGKNWPMSHDREQSAIIIREIIATFSLGRMFPFLVLLSIMIQSTLWRRCTLNQEVSARQETPQEVTEKLKLLYHSPMVA